MLRDKLKAIDHLGRVHGQYFEYQIAKSKHEEAVETFEASFEADDMDLLEAKDNLAMTLLDLDGVQRLKRAQELMQDVYDRRERKLGKEHSLTLWAKANLARTKAKRGVLEGDSTLVEDAVEMFESGLKVAKRDLGPNNIGTLFGRHHLADTLRLQKRYAEAEEAFVDIMERQRKLPGARNGCHPDRIASMGLLVECYEAQERYDECLALCEKVIDEVDAMGGQHHPMRQKAVRKREDIVLKMRMAGVIENGEDIPEELRRRRTSAFIGRGANIGKA